MTKQFFDHDNFYGLTEHIGKNDKGQTVIQRTQNTDKIVRANMQEMNSHIANNWRGDMHKVASIPLIVIDMWREEMKKAGYHNCDPLHADNRTFLIAKINSSEWSGLRTKPGKI
jgi:hypothetical protein